MGLSWLELLFSVSLLTAHGLPTAAQATTDAGPLTVTRGEEEDAWNLGSSHLQMPQIREEDSFRSAPTVPAAHRTPQVLLATPTLTPSQSIVIENKGPLTLWCTTPDTLVTIHWLFQNLPLALEAHMVLSTDGRNLTFITVHRTDSGTYQCKTDNGTQSQQSNPLSLQVNYGPDPFTIKLDVKKVSGKVEEVLEGSQVTFSVDTQSYPLPTYTWDIPSGLISQPTTNKFTIFSMTKEHSGTYKCVVTNQVTQLTQIDTLEIRVLDVLTRPSIEVSSNFLVESENSPPVNLTCRTSHTGLGVRWLLADQPLKPSGRLVLSADNRTLVIHQLRRTDTGPYQCLVWHSASEARSDPIGLTIYYGPDQVNISSSAEISPSSVIEAALDSSLSLRCQADAYPSPRYRWTSNSFLPISAEGQLVFKAVTWEDEGMLRCTASNPRTDRSASAFVVLKVRGPSPALSAGAIAGIVVAAVAVVVAVGLLLFFFFRKARRRTRQHPSNTVSTTAAEPPESRVNDLTCGCISSPESPRRSRWKQRPGKPEPPAPLGTEASAYQKNPPSGNGGGGQSRGVTSQGNMESAYEKFPPSRNKRGNGHFPRSTGGVTSPGNMESAYEMTGTHVPMERR